MRLPGVRRRGDRPLGAGQGTQAVHARPAIGLTGVTQGSVPGGLLLKSAETGNAHVIQSRAEAPPAVSGTAPARDSSARTPRRGLAVLGGMAAAFLLVGAQLVRLGLASHAELSIAVSEPIGRTHARPDIVDRAGRLIATDLVVHSLYADPAMVLDADVASERIAALLGDVDQRELRAAFADRSRRFVWVRRGLTPAVAQRVHDLGLPGLGFRKELRRAYPLGRLAGHVVGSVNIDNRGLAGIERHIDEAIGIEAVAGVAASSKLPVRLSIDVGVQAAVEEELAEAAQRFVAKGAAAVVIDADSGQVVASASLPTLDPARPLEALDAARLDKTSGGTYELGSVLKALTIAMALDRGQARLDTLYDVRQPLVSGRFTVRDLHPLGRPLSLAEIFIHSSNVGAGMIARDAGAGVQRAFLARLGLTEPMAAETGPVAAPQLPHRWDDIETVTISYGHGLAVAPLQFAAVAASLVNGGFAIKPRFLVGEVGAEAGGQRGAAVLSPQTSQRMRDLMRLNVTSTSGTGRRADVPGYEVGGKTGTAEMAVAGGYKRDSVIASFLAAFPMSRPRYVVYVMLFEPTGTDETRGQITAGYNAAATAGRVIGRIAPVLGVVPVPPRS